MPHDVAQERPADRRGVEVDELGRDDHGGHAGEHAGAGLTRA